MDFMMVSLHELIRDMNALKTVPMPVMDVRGVKVKNKMSMPLSQVYGYLKASKTMSRLSKVSIGEYINRFQHSGIKELLRSVISMEDYNAMSLVITLGGFVGGDSGYPMGGSLQLTQNMVNTFQNLGGTIVYNQAVEQVEVEEGCAKGVWIKQNLYRADAVIVSADTLVSTQHLFKEPLHEKWIDQLHNEITPVNCTFISLGVKVDLSYLPANMILSLKQTLVYHGKMYQSITLNNYATFEGYSPKGCTAITTMLFEDTYDEWKQAKKDGSYQHKKDCLAETIIDLLEESLPELKGNIDVWDVATPLTYERYCGTFRGSWMSVMKPNAKSRNYKGKSESIQNLYFSGQRLMVPGGMPSALMTSRTAVQLLCKDTNTMFQGKL